MEKKDEDPLSDPWPSTKVLFEELTLHFQVISERDYACHKIENFKPGTMRVDDFMVEFEALIAKVGIKDQEQTVVDLLECNTNQEIIKELFKQDHRKTTRDAKSIEGWSMEIFQYMTNSTWSKGSTGSGSHQHKPAGQAPTKPPTALQYVPMDVDMAQTKSKVQCYKCRGYGHFACDCKWKVDVHAMDHDEIHDHFFQEFQAMK
ncbi:hypothetical protein H0H81_004321, partial [Sphagnurus paluster]